MRQFSFDHVFRASSPAAVFAAYFDPAHTAEQDRRLDVVERAILERTETDDELVRVSRVVPKRQLPAVIRPFVSDQLHYVERARWRKREDEIELSIRPSLLGGRASVTALYQLTAVGPGEVRRRYEGSVSVDVPLVSSRIERGIVAELERSLPLAAGCTQDWLDRVDGEGCHSLLKSEKFL